MKKTIILCLAIILVSGFYLINSHGKSRELQKQVASIETKISSMQADDKETLKLEENFAAATDVAAFTEDLYTCARKAGIRFHEVVTVPVQTQQLMQRGRGRARLSDLQINRLQISVSGSFRRMSDYIDRAQKLEQVKKITEISITPGPGKLNAKIIIDLYSLGAKNAS